jgi:tetratricopeptide (TPR) repeat protein
VLANATPTRAWAERERWFLKGIAVDPHNVSLARHYGNLLRQVGRTRDAVAQLRRAASIELFERKAHQELALALAATGRREEGAAILEEAEKVWPDTFDLKRDKFIFAMDTGSFSDALRQLDTDPVFANSVFQPEALAATRAQITAVQSGDARRKRETAGVVTSAADHGALPSSVAMLFLDGLGDLDGAFRQGERAADGSELRRPYTYTTLTLTPLFLRGNAPMRRDPRFMSLAAKFGLVDYWRSTGHWPDFCSEQGLPYDCKAEAARLVSRP